MNKINYKSIILGIVIILILLVSATYAYFSITNSNDTEFNLSLGIDKEATITLTTGLDILNIVLNNDDMNEENIGTTYYFTKVSDLVNANRTTTKTSDNIATLATISLTDGMEGTTYECNADITVSSSGDMKSGLSLGDAVYYIDNINNDIYISNNSFDLSKTTTRNIVFFMTRTDSESDTLNIGEYAILNNTNSDQTNLQDTSLSIDASISNLSCGIINYQKVKYLQSSGKQYIDTGIRVNSLSNVIIDTKYMKLDSSDTDVFGTSSVSTNTILWNTTGSNSTSFYPRWGTTAGQANNFKYESPYSANVWGFTDAAHILLLNGTAQNMVAYVDNVKVATYYYYTGSFSSSENILVFKGRTYSLAKWYWFNIINEDINILNLIPAVRKSDSKPGMYDTVTKTFFTNSGTGEFGYETLDGVYVSPTQ